MEFFDKIKSGVTKVVVGDGSHKVEESEKTIESVEAHNSALNVARTHHADYMDTWQREHGNEPRMKDGVDIAHTAFDNLPAARRADTLASAQPAVDEVRKEIARAKKEGSGPVFDATFIDRVATMIHVGWLERNGTTATNEQKEAYAALSDTEKEKDRLFVELAIKLNK